MKKKTPRLVIYAALSLITVLIWFGTEIFRNLTKKPETKVPDEVLSPLDPTLDQDSLNKLEGSLFFDPSQIVIPEIPIASEVPISEATLAPLASPTAEPNPSPTETTQSSPTATPTSP